MKATTDILTSRLFHTQVPDDDKLMTRIFARNTALWIRGKKGLELCDFIACVIAVVVVLFL